MIDNNLKNAIAGEKLKLYKVNNPNLLARYVVMMSKIRSSASIGIIDLMFFLVFIVIGAINHELIFSIINNFNQIFTNPLIFIETYFYPICISLILVTVYSYLRNIDTKLFNLFK